MVHIGCIMQLGEVGEFREAQKRFKDKVSPREELFTDGSYRLCEGVTRCIGAHQSHENIRLISDGQERRKIVVRWVSRVPKDDFFMIWVLG